MALKPQTKAPEAKPAAAPPGVEIVGSEEAFRRFLPAAELLAPHELVPFRVDGSLAAHNVAAGVAAVMPRKANVLEDLPKVNFDELATLPDLSLGVVFAQSQVTLVSGSTHTTGKMIVEAGRLRELMLTSAEALAFAGLVESREVHKIRAGKGKIDMATDCVNLASLFGKMEPVIRAKTPVTSAQVRRAAELGTALLAILKPKTAKKGKSSELTDAVEARDRLWTLLVRRHDVLTRVACWLWGEDEMHAHVPSLLSHVAFPRKKKAGASATTPPPAQ